MTAPQLTRWTLVLFCGIVAGCDTVSGLEPIQNPAISDPAKTGACSWTIQTTDTGLLSDSPDIKNYCVRIPGAPATAPFPTIVLQAGFASSASKLSAIQDQYASHGFLVFAVDNKQHLWLFAPYYNAYMQSIDLVLQENRRPGSALYGLIDTNAIGLCGHSMAGGAALMVANAPTDPRSRRVKTVVAINPFGGQDASSIRAAACLVSSADDIIATPASIYASYQSLSDTLPRVFANYAGMIHNTAVDWDRNANVFFPLIVSWFKTYLAGDSRYDVYIDQQGSEHNAGAFTASGSVPSYEYRNPQ